MKNQMRSSHALNLLLFCFGQKEDSSDSQVSKLREKLQLISALSQTNLRAAGLQRSISEGKIFRTGF